MSLDFIQEEVKKKPVNKNKLLKKILVSIVCAIVFGIVASLVILVLEPFFEKITTKDNSVKPSVVDFEDELSPEEMLSGYMLQESSLYELEGDVVEENEEAVEIPLSDDQINAILNKVTLDFSDYKVLSNAVSLYMREISKYMVTIKASTTSIDWMNTVNDESNTVSGVVVANNNVEIFAVADSKNISKADALTLTFSDGTEVPAYIKGIDSDTKLAVIAVALSDIPNDYNVDSQIVSLGSSGALFLGNNVIAVGSPQGVTGSVGYGIISTSRNYVMGVDQYCYSYETNILGSKMANGAVFSLSGKLVGFITNDIQSASGNNVIMFYGVSEIKNIIEDISNEKGRPYLGITGMDVTSDAHYGQGVPMGAYVVSTQMDSPAMLAGIQTGDIITEMDGNTVSTYTAYTQNLKTKKIGDEVKLTIQRKNQNDYSEMKLTLTVTER